VRRSNTYVNLVIGCLTCSMGAANSTYHITATKSRQPYSIAVIERGYPQAILKLLVEVKSPISPWFLRVEQLQPYPINGDMKRAQLQVQPLCNLPMDHLVTLLSNKRLGKKNGTQVQGLTRSHSRQSKSSAYHDTLPAHTATPRNVRMCAAHIFSCFKK
jgi:hypothetical protein